eukprot:TRINITY_DN3701_c0_g1_i1.p1 TRINITY_DN3701_c0_g1~~TRINITY_DN3701_c0_g1_i1.p1  ORF type:complete len:336 (-),score=65.43 TRINITY_DN3701_c0_g1_i1:28-1035(-)
MTQKSDLEAKSTLEPQKMLKNNPIQQANTSSDSNGSNQQITEIVPGLFLSGFSDAKDFELLHRLGIDHVLSTACEVIDNQFLSSETSINHKIMNIKDDDDEFVIRFFDETNLFIEKAMKSRGKVLVHCMMGLSRSVSIVAAYLIHTFGMSDIVALKKVEDKRGLISPNEGFRNQLRLYSLMEGKLDGSTRYHKIYQIGLLKSKRDNAQLNRNALQVRPPQGVQQAEQYACFHCSSFLFHKGNVYQHEPFNSSKVIPEDSCNFYFVEPLAWMAATGSEELIMENSGIIYCQECDNSMGEWNWRGSACPDCNTFVAPSFRISKKETKRVKDREIVSS